MKIQTTRPLNIKGNFYPSGSLMEVTKEDAKVLVKHKLAEYVKDPAGKEKLNKEKSHD